MTAAQPCGLAWCVVDHNDRFDDWDGEGRFHSSAYEAFTPDPILGGGRTWGRGSAVDVKMMCWSSSDGSDEVRLDIGDAVLTPAEVRQLAEWLLGWASRVDAVQAHLVTERFAGERTW